MHRGPIYQSDYRPQFTGHETFPLRYGWLKKAYDRVLETEKERDNKRECWGEEAIARFGVGKNMVSSIRHWAISAEIIHEPSGTNSVITTKLGRMLLDSNGLDPYMEDPATLWLIHWKLSAYAERKTTWFWTFNYFPSITFEREHLVKRLERLAKEQSWARVAYKTLKNDVACFIRTYTAQSTSESAGHDDALESPLTELGLIKAIGSNDGFRIVRGQKTTLGDGVFAYSLLDFWSRYSNSSTTLSFETIAHEPGSPGRVFLLDENDVADRLINLENVTGGLVRWSETAGLKQVVREAEFNIDLNRAIEYIALDYSHAAIRQEVI